jgi:hypothetical protein
MNALSCALAAVYLFSALTTPGGHPGAAVVEAGIGVAELIWIAAIVVSGRRPWAYFAGTALQLTLTILWVVSRTAGLPGGGRLAVGEFDLLCAADALGIAALSWRCASPRRQVAGRMRLGLCQLAVILAACTAYLSMASMMTMTASPTASAGPASHGQVTERFFCHLL